MSDPVILKARARGLRKTYAVKIDNGRVYVNWAGWTDCGKFSNGFQAIVDAEAKLAEKRAD